MKVVAYQCDICESIFKSAAGASRCKKSCQKEADDLAKKEAERNASKELADYVRLNASSPEEICKLMIEVSKKMDSECYIEDVKLVVNYNPLASNSHSAPIGKMENWSGSKPGVPRGYPGLVGNITIQYNKQPKSMTKAAHEKIVGINTGCGGYRNGKNWTLGYDVTLWVEDFPKIQTELEKTLEKIKEFEEVKIKALNELEAEVKANQGTIQLEAEREILINKIKELETQLRDNSNKARDIRANIAKPYIKLTSDKHKEIPKLSYFDIPHNLLTW